MNAGIECDGGPHCQAADHIEGCFRSTMHRRSEVPLLPVLEENSRLRAELAGAVAKVEQLEKQLMAYSRTAAQRDELLQENAKLKVQAGWDRLRVEGQS